MSPRVRSLGVGVVLVGWALALSARADGLEELFPPGWSEGIAWAPQPVRTPVRVEDAKNVAPWVPASARQVTGEVELGPDRGAALWLSPLDVVRVTALDEGEPFSPHFVRVPQATAPDAPKLAVDEPGVPAKPGSFYLAEPQGPGSLWIVTAPERIKVRFDRPMPIRAEMADEAVRAGLLAWVDGRREMPAVPFSAHFRQRLQADAELGAALVDGTAKDAPLRWAVTEWRKASALQGWLAAQPFYLASTRIVRPRGPGGEVLLDGAQNPYFRPEPKQQEWTFEVQGPCVIGVEVRRLLRADDATPSTVELSSGSEASTEVMLAARPGFDDPDEREAVPVTRKPRELPSGEWVGSAQELRLVLRPGKHQVRVRWSAPTLLRPRIAVRRPFLEEVLEGEASWEDLADRAAALIGQDRSAGAELLRHRLHELGVDPVHPDCRFRGCGTEMEGRPEATPFDPAGAASATLNGEADRGSRQASIWALLRAVDAVDRLEGNGATDDHLLATAAHAVQQIDLGAAPALGWELRLRVAQTLVNRKRPAEARELLASASKFPQTGWAASEAAVLVTQLPLGDPLRSRSIAALELAWRREPLALDLRRRYRQLWAMQSRWTVLPPDSSNRIVRPTPEQWLDVEPVDAAEPVGARSDLGTFIPVEGGGHLKVHVDGAPGAPNLLRALLVSPKPPASTPVLRVDGKPVPVLLGFPLEQAVVALPPGDHAVELDAEAGVRGYVSLASLAERPRELGFLRSQFPVRFQDAAVRFQLPDVKLPSPVRIQLRSTEHHPLTVWMHTDVGRPVRIQLAPATSSPAHFNVARHQAEGASAAAVVVAVPPLTRHLWFEPEDKSAQLFVSVGVRRDLDPPNPAGAFASAPPPADAMERLLSLSRVLSATPEAIGPRLERAQLLISLGEEGLARQDVLALVPRQDALTVEEYHQVLALLRTFQQLDAPNTIRFSQPVTAPVVLEPATSALALRAADRPGPFDCAQGQRCSKWAAAARALWTGSAPGPTGDALLDHALHAEALERQGDPDAAAVEWVRLFRETQLPQVGLAALAALESTEAHAEHWSASGAPMSLAVATELSSWADLPLIRRMKVAGQKSTRWDRLPDADEKAGLLQALAGSRADRPDEQVRKALLAPPWGLEGAQLLHPGSTSLLDYDSTAEGDAGAEVLCGAVRIDPTQALAPCTLELRVDGATVETKTVAPGATALIANPNRDPGRHQVELLLAPQKAPAMALVRFVQVGKDEPKPLARQTALTMLRARPGEPVVVTVLGPAVVRITGRPLGSLTGDRRVLIRAQAVDAGTEGSGSGSGNGSGSSSSSSSAEEFPPLQLASATDATVVGAKLPVGAESETILVLSRPGPQTLRIEAPDGEAGVQIDLAEGRPFTAVPSLAWTFGERALEPLPWPPLPDRLSLLPDGYLVRDVRSWGTLSAEVAYRQEDVGDGDQLNRPLQTGLETSLAYRQELSSNTTWLKVMPRLRFPLDAPMVAGLSAGFYARNLPAQLRAYVSGGAYTQAIDGNSRWSAKLRGALSSWIHLVPDLSLVPGIGASVETYQGANGTALSLYDQSVYWQYGAERSRRATPWTSLRWQPLQDQLGELTVAATANLVNPALDHADAQLRWASFIHWPLPRLRADATYEISYRAQDPWRPQAYVRHGVRLELDYTIWVGGENRLMLIAEDRALYSGPFGFQNIGAVGIRWDWSGGRGLRDDMPLEGEFEQLLDPQRSIE